MTRELTDTIADADQDDISVEDGLVTIEDETLQPITGDDIRQADLDREAEMTGLDKRQHERAAERYEADRLYDEHSEAKPASLRERLRTGPTRLKQRLNGALERLSSLSTVFIRQPDYPIHATVNRVSGTDGSITLHLSTACLDDKTASFDPDSDELGYLLSYTDAATPSDLEEQQIPIKPRVPFDDLDYTVHTDVNTGLLPTFQWKRLMLRVGAYSKKRHSNNNGIHANRNFSLINALLLLAVGVPTVAGAFLTSNVTLGVTLAIIGAFPLIFGGMFAVAYIFPVVLSLVDAGLELLFGEV